MVEGVAYLLGLGLEQQDVATLLALKRENPGMLVRQIVQAVAPEADPVPLIAYP